MVETYSNVITTKKRYMKLIIIMIITVSLTLISCNSKTNTTQVEVNKKPSDLGTDVTTEVVTDNRESEYDDFLLFINNKDNRSLYLLNKKSKECSKIYDNVVSIMGSVSYNLKKLEKTNYFLANGNLLALDGDTFKITNVMEYEYGEYEANNIFINVEGSIYLKNIESHKQKMLLSNMEFVDIVYKDGLLYMKIRDVNSYYIYKYDMEAEKMDKIYDLKDSYCKMAIDDNRNIYVMELQVDEKDSIITKYDISSNRILQLKEDKNDTSDDCDGTIIYLDNSLYVTDKDSFRKMVDKDLISAASIDNGIYLMTNDTDIVELDTNTLELTDVLYLNHITSNNYNNQNELIKIEDDNVYFNDQFLTDSMAEGQEEQNGSTHYYYIENGEHETNIGNPYVVKDKKTYLRSDIDKIEESIKEEFNEYSFSEELISYTTKNDKHLVILDRNTNEKIYTSDYPVSNIQVFDNEVYYIRYINGSGFYCYHDGENTLIDKTIVSDYAVTNENIYYNTIYNNELRCKNKQTEMNEDIKFLTTYRSNDEGLKDINEKISYMVSNSDTFYFVIDDMLYKRKDHEDNKELINILPSDFISYLFLHENNIFTGYFGITIDDININSYDIDYKKPYCTIYEDDRTIIYPVPVYYREASYGVYVYDKEDKQIKDIIYSYDKTNTSIIKDAVFISGSDKTIYKIDLETLDLQEIYRTDNYYDYGESIKFFIINERYCVIGDCNNAGIDELKGITILDLQDTVNVKCMEDVELLYAQGDYAYYRDEEDTLMTLDLSNGINTKGNVVCNHITDYRATYNQYIFFQGYNDLIMVDNTNNISEVVCDGNYHDIVSVSSRDNTDLVLIYLDYNHNLITFDKGKSILGENIHNYRLKNDILIFHKKNEDGKNEIYTYDINKETLSIIDVDIPDDYNFDYYILDNKVVVKLSNPNGEKVKYYFSPEGKLIQD